MTAGSEPEVSCPALRKRISTSPTVTPRPEDSTTALHMESVHGLRYRHAGRDRCGRIIPIM